MTEPRKSLSMISPSPPSTTNPASPPPTAAASSPYSYSRHHRIASANAAIPPTSLPPNGAHLKPSASTLSSTLASAQSRLRRTLSVIRTSNDLRFDVFFRLPGHEHEKQEELPKLRVHRSISLTTLQAMIQREFGIAYQDQRLFCHGEVLEGDEDLSYYEIHDHSVIQVRIVKRFRRIGDIFNNKVRVISFVDENPDDFDIVEVVASLPPLKVVFRRLAIAIAYLMSLDHLQFKRTKRFVWRQQVHYWEEALPVFGHKSLTTSEPSFVLAHCSPERVSYLMSLAQKLSLRERLLLPPDVRSQADLRHIRKWLSSIKYFADANIPDQIIHEVARFSTFASFKAGDYIFREGDVGDFFYIVISGCVSLSAYGNGLFATMTPGMCFGEISLFQLHGQRTATATVNFVSPEAELAVVSGEVYRRSINPFKQAVLQTTERWIYSIPSLRALPDHIITHIAYAAKTLTAKTGRKLLQYDDDVHVLILLVQGDVKVSTPRRQRLLRMKSPRRSSLLDDPDYLPIVSVVRAPAVFGQEGCLSNTPQTAAWDIEAMGNVTVVCLRMDTISIFLSPHHDILKALWYEHATRVRDFHERFELARSQQRKRSDKEATKRKPSFLMGKKHQLDALRPATTTASLKSHTAMRIPFPKILLRDDELLQEGTNQKPMEPSTPSSHPRSFMIKSPRLMKPKPPTCADVTKAFLHQALPYPTILTLEDQLRHVSFAQQMEKLEEEEERTQALVHGLRQLPAEDVQLIASNRQYRVVPLRPST